MSQKQNGYWNGPIDKFWYEMYWNRTMVHIRAGGEEYVGNFKGNDLYLGELKSKLDSALSSGEDVHLEGVQHKPRPHYTLRNLQIGGLEAKIADMCLILSKI